MTNYAGKCGTCVHFERYGERRVGWCHNYTYDESEVHDPKHPYPARSMSNKCRYYSNVRPTNADRIRAMSDEEMARTLLFFRPSDVCFIGTENKNYTGLDGKYYKLGVDAVEANLKWLHQPAEEDWK